jgi:hypothetical protein
MRLTTKPRELWGIPDKFLYSEFPFLAMLPTNVSPHSHKYVFKLIKVGKRQENDRGEREERGEGESGEEELVWIFSVSCTDVDTSPPILMNSNF